MNDDMWDETLGVLKEDFLKENETFIKLIGDLDHSEAALLYLDKLKNENIFHYAEVQLGLAKALDFLIGADYQQTNVLAHVSNIINLAYQITYIHVKKCSSLHEDGACLTGYMNHARVFSDFTFNKWPKLPLVQAINFSGKIIPEILPANTIIYRVFNSAITNSKKGNWWFENKPTTKKNWRSDYAVPSAWNNGTNYVQYTLDDKLLVWKGIAASQAVPNNNCYLTGGNYQLWVDIHDLTNIGNATVFTFP